MVQKFRTHSFKRYLILILFISALGLGYSYTAKADGCHTGAEALANVYVRMSPVNAYYFGSVEDYIQQNRAHFVAGGDAVVCAQSLSAALVQGAYQNYDPNYWRDREELNARLGAMGISPGPQQASPAAQMFAMGRQMGKLADTLPYAAQGNFAPLWQPRDELERMQLFAMQMFGYLMEDPTMRSVMNQMQPQIKQLANMEYQMILGMASQLP